jgi:hypothetical protein
MPWSLWGKKRKHVSFEEQVRVLESCGIRLNPGVRCESLLQSLSRERMEGEPFRLLLCVMGGEAGESGYPSDHIWHFDTECIEGSGSYIRIASRMCTLAQGGLPLADIEDLVEVEEGMAWLSFSLEGKTERWAAKVEDDWVDAEVLSRFARLLESREMGRRYTYIDLQGQDCDGEGEEPTGKRNGVEGGVAAIAGAREWNGGGGHGADQRGEVFARAAVACVAMNRQKVLPSM